MNVYKMVELVKLVNDETYHVSLLVAHSVGQTLWRHPFYGELPVTTLPVAVLLVNLSRQSEICHLDPQISIHPKQ